MKLTAVFVLALALRIGLAALWYTDDYRNFQTGDYGLYRIGAEHVREHGDFSNSLFLPRPPLYILLLAILPPNDTIVLTVNILLGALLAPLTVLLAGRLGLAERGALLAGGIAAVDPGSIAHSAFLGPEPLANVLLVASLIVLADAAQKTLTQRRRDAEVRREEVNTPQPPPPAPFSLRERGSLWLGAVAGGLLALSALTRPASYLLWIPLALLVVVLRRSAWRAAAAFAIVAALGVGAWVAHNAAVFQNPTFSTVSGFTMLYYRAASVEYLATGQPIEDVYRSINQRVEQSLGRNGENAGDQPDYAYHAASPDVMAVLNGVSFDIFRAHPMLYVATFPLGLARMYGLVPTVSKFDGALAWVDTVWNVALVAFATLGMWRAWRGRNWWLLGLTVLVVGYFTAGTLLVKTAGLDTRERSMFTPLLAVVASYQLSAFSAQLKAKDVITEKPRDRETEIFSPSGDRGQS